MAFLANLRSTIAYQPSGATVSTGAIYTAASSGAVWSNALVSSMVSIGTSTNQTYTTLSQGNFTSTSNWVTTLTGRTSTIGVSMSANAQTQLVVSQVSTVSSIQFTSTLGQTWSTLSNVTGLPSSLTTSYSAGAISGNGQYGLLAASGGYLYTTANSGASWTNTNPNTGLLYVHLPFEGNANDISGNGRNATVTGSPGYVPGIVGKNAINLANTPIGTATQYIRGLWLGAPNFTVSFWCNPQTAASSMIIFSFGGSFTIQTNGTAGLQFNAPGISVSVPYPVAANTWYNITVIYQANSTCSFYVNNVLIAQPTSTGIISESQYGLGTYSTATSNAFNGYIDDFKIYASSPSIYLPFDTAPVNGAIGGTTLTVVGSPALVPGIVGTNAVNLVNTPAGNATQYIRGSWTNGALTSFTVSFWFNQQSTVSGQCYIFSAFNNTCSIQTSTASNILGFTIPTTASPYFLALTVPVAQTIALNTWYNVTLIYQSTGMCYAYLNNALYGTATGAGIFGLASSNLFGLSGFDNGTSNAFNGYIDDLKIYNSAISTTPFSPMVPQNWSNIALSNSGQYMLATATGSGLFLSSNYGSTWTQVTSAMLYAAWTAAQVSATGQYLVANSPVVNVQPQLTGLATNTWQKGGITWTASASSAFPGAYYPYQAFDGTGYQWASSKVYNSSGGYTGSFSTIVNGSIIIRGEYLQLQSVTPVQMYSYTFSGGEYLSYPNGYTIAGSNDGSTWYLLQTVAMSGNPTGTTTGASSSSYIIVNQSGAQTMTTTGGTATFTCTTSSYTTTPYSYFRIIIPAIFNNTGTTYTSLQEWIINFQAGGQTYSTNYGSTWNTAFPLYSMIQPLQYGLASNTWNQNGVSWTASASVSNSAGQGPFNAFSGLYAIAWVGALNSYRNVSPYDYILTTYVTPITSVGTIYGDWLQIQSSGPLIMTSYTFASSGILQQPQTYYIAGSNDGTTWYPIQYATGTVNPLTASSTACSTYLSVSSSTIPVSQPIQGNVAGAYTTRGYSTSTGSYIYFRIIVTNTWGYTNGNTNIGQWFINFTSGTQTTQSLSPSGLTALTGYTAGTISPQQTGLTGDTTSTTPVATTWNQNGVTWTSNVSSVVGNGYQSWVAFNNTVPSSQSGGPYSWASPTIYDTSTGVYNGSVSTTVSGSAVPGEWIQIQSSISLVINSYNFGIAAFSNTPRTFVIAGSTDGTTWTTIHSVTAMSANPFGTTPFVNATSAPIRVNGPTSQIMTSSGGSGTLTCATNGTATTDAYTYFRFIIRTTFGGYGNAEVEELFLNFTTPSNTSLYNIVSPLTNLLTGSSVTSGSIPGVITGSAVSNTGQYMVVITNNTTGNNVYYSTNTGVIFTGLQLGSLPLTSCAISYDGSYITVSNATTVYQLNNNSSGYSVAVGNQAGAVNQYQNAIAIGNYAGYQNQTANSIILNATGSTVNSVAQGFYVAPIASYTASSSPYLSVMGYGLDNQVTHSNGAISMLSNGNVGIGTTSPTTALHVNGTITASGGITNMGWTQVNYYGSNGYLSFPGPGGSVYYILSGTVTSSDSSYFYVYPPVPCFLTGYVVYGINTPSQPQAQAPLAAGYPTSTKVTYASFNLGGVPVGSYTTMIHYTVYCRT